MTAMLLSPATLTPRIQVDGAWLNTADAAQKGLILTQTLETTADGTFARLSLENRSGKEIRLDEFNWHRKSDHGDFLNTPGLCVYLEAWQMATPCGVRHYGDHDFEFDPGYINNAISDPAQYSALPNHFRSDWMVMFHDGATGRNLLAGFVTTADQFGHFKLELSADGVASLDIFSAGDGMAVPAGKTVASETLMIAENTDAKMLKEHYATVWGARMHARNVFPPAVGWCSWYYYFSKVTGEDIRENVEFIAANRDRYPLRYIQLDDGYQSALGDWLVCNEKFPRGLEGVVSDVRSRGFIPALWLGPFMVEDNSELLKTHPEWMIHDEAGNVIMEFNWREGHKVAVLDGTHPGVQAHFRELFRKVRALGFDYVKLDFLFLASVMRNGVLYDRQATRAQALRRGMEAIREGFGEDGYILGCTVPFGPMVGIVDGERISTDITPYWAPDRKYYDEAPTVPNVCRNVIHHTYMHRKLWNNDPDTLIVRTDNVKLTENEVRLWYQAVRLSGGMLLLSDRFSTLAPERAKMPMALLKEPDAYRAYPADIWERTFPAVWKAEHIATGSKETGLFNFEDHPCEINGHTVPAHSCLIVK